MVSLVLGKTRTTVAPRNRVSSLPTTPVIISGNSGTDHITNFNAARDMVRHVAGGATPSIAISSITGSSWMTRYNTPTDPPDAKTDIANYDVLLITNGSGMFNIEGDGGDNLGEYGATWADWTWANGRGGLGAETLWWTTWAKQNSNKLANFASKKAGWLRILAENNARLPLGKMPIRIIPGTWLWEKFLQDQTNSLTPTATWYDDLFLDDFHQNDHGRYICAALAVCCLYGIDPKALPATIAGYTDQPTTADLAYIRASIKAIVSAFPQAGVDTSGWT